MDKTLWLNQCHFGDVRSVLRRMVRDGVKVDCIVTSPPYWGLRDYGADGQIGLEPSFKHWLGEMRKVFKLLHQVLADDGTAWINMGDSYASRGGKTNTQPKSGTKSEREQGARGGHEGLHKGRGGPVCQPNRIAQPGFKTKDLIGQPWRLAFALQDAGWYLRQDIIWAKPNPMPESIKDRCTKSHEYLFLLSKSERYHFDFEAFQEPVNGGGHARRPSNGVGFGHSTDRTDRQRVRQAYKTPDGWDTRTGQGGHGAFHAEGREAGRKLADIGRGIKNNASFDDAIAIMPSTRNRRSVWTIATEAFDGAHFATFPKALVEPCIVAGCPARGVVLDPFFGTGTTGEVAQQLGRDWIGIEINRNNEQFQRKRLAQLGLVL